VAEASTIETSQQGIVVVLDALATKGILARQPLPTVFENWHLVQEPINRQVAILESLDVCQLCRAIWLSDTVIITLFPNESSDIWTCVSLIAEMLQSAMWQSMELGIFFRGAMSVGELHVQDTKVIGSAIEEASAWYEHDDWIGVRVTPSLELLLEVLPDKRTEYYVRCDIPSNKGGLRRQSLTLNWPHHAQTASDDPRTALITAFRRFSGPIAPGLESKYWNTLSFFDSIIR